MKATRNEAGFTLVEVIVAGSVILVLAAILLSATHHSGRVLQQTAGKIEQFREARVAFESLTRRLSEATLNTYWDYTFRTERGIKIPTAYARQSELRFRSGRMEKLAPSTSATRPTHGIFFQAPVGEVDELDHRRLDQALCTWGFFLEVGTDEHLLPLPAVDRVAPRMRSRLYEFRQPTEALSIYDPSGVNALGWFAPAINAGTGRPARVLAENVVALILLPRLSHGDELARGSSQPTVSPLFEYDSTLTSNAVPPLSPPAPELNPKNQLPPILQVVMVAVDEPSADRLAEKYPERTGLDFLTEGLFEKAERLEDDPNSPEPGDGDLRELEQRLIAERASYRVFSSNVAIRGAKWSRSQTN